MVNLTAKKKYLSVFQRVKELKELIKDGETMGFSETLMNLYRNQLELAQKEILEIKKVGKMVVKQ